MQSLTKPDGATAGEKLAACAKENHRLQHVVSTDTDLVVVDCVGRKSQLSDVLVYIQLCSIQ